MALQDPNCPIINVSVKFNQENPFKGPSVQGDLPISYPLNNLDQLLEWKPNDPEDHGQLFSVASVPHSPKIISETATKTLMCHDMKGGYLNDRFVQAIDGDAYHTRYWNMVDIFVYFSHHFVTVPPVSWINAAHRNGVTVLGTFITEGEEGYERCAKIFSSEQKWQQVADQLVEIARFYRFDGWFINIENIIDARKVSAVVGFVGYLTKKMHALDGNALVIWYDSVTECGTLAWQNELNKNNKCFYDKCDGIFLNYAWNEAGLNRSKTLSRHGSSVFVGIDVFGRGCYGGGGFNSRMAMDVIRRCDLSAGLFAPGWVYEKFGCIDFDKNDKRFWKALQPCCQSHPFVAAAGLASSFNPGCYEDKWCLLNGQATMPLLPSRYLSVVADESKPCGNLVVTVPSEVEERGTLIGIFKMHMVLRGACATLVSPVDCDFQFVLESDRGIIKPSGEGRKQFLPSEENVKITHFTVDGTLVVQGLAIEIQDRDLGCEFPVTFLHLLPGLRGERDFALVTASISCTDVFWMKSYDDSSFFFSCSLLFDDLPAIVASSKVKCVVFSVDGAREDLLGSCFCPRFRVSKLRVPNPMIKGPGCYLVFKVTHLSCAGIKVGSSQLKVVYAENIGTV